MFDEFYFEFDPDNDGTIANALNRYLDEHNIEADRFKIVGIIPDPNSINSYIAIYDVNQSTEY